jgi:glutamate racemase
MNQAIAIFDSGLGGLTVVKELTRWLPHEDLVYFGDTARVPYGTKSAQTVIRFSIEIVDFLAAFDPKMIVVACNTASAMALAELRERVRVPVVGVIEPGAAAAAAASRSGRIGVIGTEATVRSRAYPRAILNVRPKASVFAQSCPLLVPIVEEGRTSDDPVVVHAVHGYLAPLVRNEIDVLILGCTHYPLLHDVIAAEVGERVVTINSARETARAVADVLDRLHLAAASSNLPTYRFFASDNPDRFATVGRRFMGEVLRDVQLAVLGEGEARLPQHSL